MRRWPVSCIVSVATLALAGCGGTAARHSRLARTEVFGAGAPRLRDSRFVHRAGQTGADFLIPAAMDFSYVDLVSAPVLFGDTSSLLDDIAGTVRATLRTPGRVELLATGRAGTLARIDWEETCGSPHAGGDLGGGRGGGSHVTALIPAVIKVQLPGLEGGRDRCRVAAMLYTRTPTRAALALLNY